jgi:hypothetical protein
MRESETLMTAHVTRDDWTGSAAAAVDRSAHGADLHEYVGLSADEWWIVAIDLIGADWDYAELCVYAVDRKRHGVDDWDSLQLLAEANGTVPVTKFVIRGVMPTDLFADVFRDIHVQLRRRDIGRDLVITDRRELGEGHD